MKLPKRNDVVKNPMEFFRQYAESMTFEDVINQKDISPSVLVMMLMLCRSIIQNARPFNPKPKNPLEMTEESYRKEVYNNSKNMNFYIGTLEQLHPVQIGEMIQILLRKLREQNIEAAVGADPGIGLVN